MIKLAERVSLGDVITGYAWLTDEHMFLTVISIMKVSSFDDERIMFRTLEQSNFFYSYKSEQLEVISSCKQFWF